ncbi:MAG TPA: rhodanese-like domain-containing protein [Rhizomicrobium sp.]|nr:rhodanese-like domain-containing protein [Rhizomicrobium sp.]
MHHIAVLIEHYGLVVVFLCMLLDQAGLPIPAFPAIMVAAALGAGGRFGLQGILIAGVVGSVIADLAWFFASRRYGRKLLSLLCRISLSPDSCVRQTENLYARVGTPLLIFAKVVPGLGIVAVSLAGTTGVSALTFLFFDLLGAGLFVGSAVLLGALFKTAIFAVIATLADLGMLGLALAIAAVAVYVAARWWQRQAFIKQLRMDRISAEELAEMIDRGEQPVILDVRPDLVRYEEGIIPGAIFAHPLEAQAALATFSRDIEVVVYCSCPNEEAAATAANHLKQAGFKKIRPLLGGIEAWTKAGRSVAIMEA